MVVFTIIGVMTVGAGVLGGILFLYMHFFEKDGA